MRTDRAHDGPDVVRRQHAEPSLQPTLAGGGELVGRRLAALAVESDIRLGRVKAFNLALSRSGVRRPDADPIRKARFREAAREIVAKDRQDRKYGLPVDTAGAVARAMERAYRQGFEDAQGRQPLPGTSSIQAGEAMDWALIPPRPRTAFWTLCLFILGKASRGTTRGIFCPQRPSGVRRDGG